MNEWSMFAHERGGTLMHVCPDSRTVSLHGTGDVHAVRVVEAGEEATHWGWLDADKPEGPPCMIWPSLVQLTMCFPYGMDLEIERGRGRMIELQIALHPITP